MPPSGQNEIIIKKVVDDDGHHDSHAGSGWKVAYADFMTAMMAFFLLLWILSVADEEKLRGLADYFSPSLSNTGGRSSGLLYGKAVDGEGDKNGATEDSKTPPAPTFGRTNPLAVFDSRMRDDIEKAAEAFEAQPARRAGLSPDNQAPDDTRDNTAESEADAELRRAAAEKAAAMAAEERDAAFEALKQRVGAAIAQRPELAPFTNNVMLDQTPEGLRVQIVDQEGRPMFPSGSARIEHATRDLIRIVGDAISGLPNPIVISGHADAVPFSGQGGYGNWELSADRANATRRVLLESGVTADRITRISGLADTEPLDPEHPTAPVNRRISILLKNIPE
ncbi:hypothetical protein BV394_05395 [Brevirhabdus pacifica]|uniref:Uncharacterized protein n=1 Tax=Brevirhabdus pacifica TaxID=1267768 RepID=A0A1U7DH43_9RHOB|nr:flagellar motor protein MotB [Brevirhabdus pacifica]APX89219.1 hypothetical protein BV394_05395 [Brevirhabdus pacifica]OWU76734.1 hypothetical protein ATO5_10890 [Loktanella sp. 22II-4b]PJJ86176.1 chemotaxis protein MotB [Brevirhabdus pacifica]